MGVSVTTKACGILLVWLTGFFLLAPLVSGETVAGRFAVISVDGSLGEWQGGDVFYNDSEIVDGVPLNSTYSSVSIVNDASHLYIGLQLKAPSSIFSNWTHTVYIDTDENSGTGFNAGWMAGGYDRLIQYGAGGGVYSIYSFSGGAQWEWSWNFLGTFNYAYDQDRIEWEIPRSLLGGAVSPRILFNTSGGDVTTDTWAYHSESGAKNYQMAGTPSYSLQIQTGRGTPQPAAGNYNNDYGTVLTNIITATAVANGTQMVCLGWTMTGHDPVSGAGTNFSMTVTNNAVLNWLWQTNVSFARTAGANGSVGTEPAGGFYPIQSSVTVTATPNAGYAFAGWSGDIAGSQTNDNPLTLTLSRTRSITANFAVDYGRFTTITMDGSLAEWQSGDVLYEDSEISDGTPDNSSYSKVSVANDHAYMYVGLELKGASSIFSDWIHTLYIDSDMNPATGYNAGWMGGGYDRLVQYGGGGGTFSIYTFTGGGQGEWSWSFTDLIQYAYDGDRIEWAIPRSALGGSTASRLQFHTGSGSVTVETWAHHTESMAKIYTFALTPSYTVTVASARGTPVPSVGPHTYDYGSVLNPYVTEPSAANGTQFVSLGWSMTGHSPTSGSATNFTTTLTNHASLTWLWQTNVQLTRSVNGSGSLSGDGDGFYARGSTVNLSASPDEGYIFAGWSGDVPAGQTNDNPLALALDRRRSVTANFAVDYGRFTVINMDGTLADWQPSDLFYTDDEIIDGAPANSSYSGVYVANDVNNLYIGLQLKAASSIFSNWTHELYIDTDNNPATGFNAGWMNKGYDRLVQYGAAGGVFSVYSFTGGTQADWSWDFLGTINYAFNGDVIEWAIPRSALGGAVTPRLEFRVFGGDVTVETWAHHTELNAKLYTMAPTPNHTLQVISHRGTPSPPVGNHANAFGSVLTNYVSNPAAANGTQYVATGWTMTGNDPLAGSATNFTMTVTNNAVLTWNWGTNVQFTRTAGANGSITGAESGYFPRNDSVEVTAVPDGGYLFAGWSGNVPGGQTNDNPLTLNLDQARAITANFRTHQGIYESPTLDGSLIDWSGIEAFYVDAEISDGSPVNSSCSSIFIANDLANLYVGLQFKAPTSINSNWVYNLFVDTDMNPATGFKGSGSWMANGYDRLIQYGANGGVYSIYSFSGGTQDEWSWNFVGLITYAFDQDVAEWAIPLSSLDIAGNACKLLFQATEGSVTVETWAHHTEASARIYTLGTPPPQILQVISAYGTAQPAAGLHTNAYGTEINCSITPPSPANGTQFVSVGWTMTGNDPVSGGGGSFSMTLTNAATLTWLWNTNVQFTRTAGANGSISGDASDYYARGDQVTITAIPNGGYSFDGWTGDVPGGQELDNPLTLTMDRARSVTANFSQNIGRFVNVTLDGSLAEWDAGDVFYADAEIIDGLPLNSTYSSIRIVNDNDYLYAGMQLKAPSSINSNWVHELYIDTDMNPATGFNAGWMGGGYDRLVQYGSGGTVYSIYAFTGGSQSDWSWNFLDTFNYGFNGDVIEWAIPRSLLGAGNIMRLEFHVVSGSVTTETWAHHTESEAKAYAFATPNNCASGIRPLLVRTSDKTIEANQLLSFTVLANDPGCVAPSISIVGKPAAASFGTSPSGTNQIGTFTWTPDLDDVDTHLLRFIAEDDQGYTTSFVMRVYVASPGEQTNGDGVPVSQTNWAVSIADLQVPGSGNVTVMWQSVSGIEYDIYKSTDAFGAGMNWSLVAGSHEASGSMEDVVMSLSGNRNFLQVVPAGDAPKLAGVWGVIKPTIPTGYSLMAPPLAGNLAFNGDFGEALADGLTGSNMGNADKVMIRESNGSWRTIYLHGSGVWYEGASPSTYTLAEGQGYYIYRSGAPVTNRFAGPVGNTGGASLPISTGWNIVGVSQGKNLAFNQMVSNFTGTPTAGWSDNAADLIIIDEGNGNWRRIMRYAGGSPTWLDLKTFSSPSITITPGQAVYYFRHSGGALSINF